MEKHSSEDIFRLIANAVHDRNDIGNLILVYFLFKRMGRKKKEGLLKLKKYVEFKGEAVTAKDIYQKSMHIVIPYEEKRTSAMYVKCIEKAKNLKQGKVYRVYTVYGAYDSYSVYSSKRYKGEYSADLFEIQDVVEIEYTGYEDEDGELKITDGFRIGESYKVLSYNGMYKCENGLRCGTYECEAKKFVKSKPKKPKPFKNKEEALQCLGNAWEFGAVRNLSEHLHPNCIFYLGQGKTLESKKAVIKFLQDFSEYSLENDFFVSCVTEAVEEGFDEDGLTKNEKCVAVYDESGQRTAIFVTLSKDRRYITEIKTAID